MFVCLFFAFVFILLNAAEFSSKLIVSSQATESIATFVFFQLRAQARAGARLCVCMCVCLCLYVCVCVCVCECACV